MHASDLFALTRVFNPTIGLNTGYDAAVISAIARLPHVKHVETQVGLNTAPLGPDGVPLAAAQGIAPVGSLDGELFDQDRVVIAQGRLADPRRADEFVIDTATAKLLGLHLGGVVSFGFYTNAQSLLPGYSSAHPPPPARRITARLVGIIGVQPGNAVRDDVDANGNVPVLFTPALTRQLLGCCADQAVTGIQLDGGSRDEAAVEAQIARIVPKGLPFGSVRLSVFKAKALRTIKPEAIALGVFGMIAGLAALLIAGQMISRQLRVGSDDLAVLRALGADPAMTVSDGLLGIGGSVVAGSVLAAVVAVGLSPLAPLGPFRRFVPIGVHADWVVLGIGPAILIVVLGGFAVAAAYLGAPHRTARRSEAAVAPRSGIARSAAVSGLPVSAVTGIRFALEPGAGRATVPVRSAIFGAALAMIVLTTTVIFGASLHTLVSRPALYGWNWDYEINGGGGVGDIAEKPVTKLLNNDSYVAAWAGYYFSVLQIDGQDVPVMGGSPGALVGPPLLSGHSLDSPDQIVLGASTLAQLHKRVGDSVEVGVRGTATTRLKIVGTGTMPAIGIGGVQHLEMGNGALLPYTVIPAASRNIYDLPEPGPNVILVRFRDGVDRTEAVRSLGSIVTTLGGQANGGSVVPLQRPAEIISYRSLGTTPTILGAALATGALAGLGLTLIATVRRRRRDLAVMKTLGFTGRQLAATVAWQATVAVATGTLVGMTLGIALGRWLWDQFATGIHAVPHPTIPAPSLAAIAFAALVLANVVAAIPGRIAARTPTALLLRTQ
ncbi:MAG TPA: FtsX-like permease family protein [Jatrophihabitantaceae bacterium]